MQLNGYKFFYNFTHREERRPSVLATVIAVELTKLDPEWRSRATRSEWAPGS